MSIPIISHQSRPDTCFPKVSCWSREHIKRCLWISLIVLRKPVHTCIVKIACYRGGVEKICFTDHRVWPSLGVREKAIYPNGFVLINNWKSLQACDHKKRPRRKSTIAMDKKIIRISPHMYVLLFTLLPLVSVVKIQWTEIQWTKVECINTFIIFGSNGWFISPLSIFLWVVLLFCLLFYIPFHNFLLVQRPH